ncbi:MAG: CYTH domain-containing protein [Bacteroidales bacterium]|nr:CYTH domain-containing protein [Bacteroidales bacterium]
MALEIERKFTICGDFRAQVTESHHIRQGYIAHENHRTVRVRTIDDRAVLTIKGPQLQSGISCRVEWEKEITMDDALELMGICRGGFIDKTRHIVPFAGHIFEVDEFHGDNEGLIFAEVELKSPDEAFERPQWLGEDVTDDSRYYNSNLLKYPYKDWTR